MYLGNNLKYLRKQRGLTQDEMPAQLGIGRGTWSNYEKGSTEPSLSTLIRISEFFQVNLADLIREDLAGEGNLIVISPKPENSKGIGKQIGKLKPQIPENLEFEPVESNQSRDKPVQPTVQLPVKEHLNDVISALKTANAALLSANQAQKDHIERLLRELNELREKLRKSGK